ncbi:MAG TPA: methyltransferase domain-containing protein [Ktedonobacterales bacterium]|nr:methyltransferase domain-containing protein [Ktedonobacterales bacterium]
MREEPASNATPARAGNEFYSIADRQAQVEYVQGRRAALWVPFLLPHVRPGMRLLDCGCGVGSITLDLAEIVAPGETVGIDVDAGQLELARAAAAARSLGNVRFAVGSIYELPFADASFDLALAHTVLVHLSEPLRALKAMRRVLAPGGIVAVSDDDNSTWVVAPEDSAMRRVMAELEPQVIAANGGSPSYSRNLRHLLLEAGFARTEGYAVAADFYGTLAETRRFAAFVGRLMRNPDLVQLMVARDWASPDELQALPAELQAWGERPDAFAAVLYCAALGWVDGETPARQDRSADHLPS